jgi:hypothetical protein
MKDGATRLAYEPEHAVDLDIGAIVAAEVHNADRGDTATLPDIPSAAEARLQAATGQAPSAEAPVELVADRGCHSREAPKDRGGRRRTWLRGRTNVHKHYLLHLAGYDLGLILSLLTRHGTPREAAAAPRAAVGMVLITDHALILIVALRGDAADEAFAIVVLVSLDG